MRRHVKYERLLAVYHDLDQTTRTSLEAHLAGCSSCAARLAGYEQVDRSLQALPDLRLPARLLRPWPTLLAGQEPRGAGRRNRGSVGIALGQALLPAGLIVILVVGAWLLLSSVTGIDPGATATPTLTLTLTPTATATALLGDDVSPAAGVIFGAAALRRVPAPLPQPPGLTAARVGASMALRIP